jgi:hypothetical protein
LKLSKGVSAEVWFVSRVSSAKQTAIKSRKTKIEYLFKILNIKQHTSGSFFGVLAPPTASRLAIVAGSGRKNPRKVELLMWSLEKGVHPTSLIWRKTGHKG